MMVDNFTFIVSNVKQIRQEFYSLVISDTRRVTSPEKEKEIPPLRVVCQSCVSLSLKKFRARIKGCKQVFSSPRNITREIMHTIALTYAVDAYPLLSSNSRTNILLFSPLKRQRFFSLISYSLSLSFFLSLSLHYFT